MRGDRLRKRNCSIIQLRSIARLHENILAAVEMSELRLDGDVIRIHEEVGKMLAADLSGKVDRGRR